MPIFFILFLTVSVLLSSPISAQDSDSTNLFSKDVKSNTVGIDVFNFLGYWQSDRFINGEFDYLGAGAFISPFYKLNINGLSFQADLMLSIFHFTGPDELTKTGPDDDIDSKFDSQMRRNDLGLQIGYDLFDFIKLSLAAKYFHMYIVGDNSYKFSDQTPFTYQEKGLLAGPALSIYLPDKYSSSFCTVSMSYLLGRLNYSYKSHRSYIRDPYESNIDTQLLSGSIGYSHNINTEWLLEISLQTEYFFKQKYEYSNKYSSDLWFIGLDTKISYEF